MVPSFQYQKLIKIPCTNSKEGHLLRHIGDRSKGFFWFRRLSPCRKVCCNQDAILLSSKHGKVWLSWDQERAVLTFFHMCGRQLQFWASPAGSPVQIPALCRNESSVQELETNGTRKTAYYWQKPFHQLQPALWVHIPKNLWKFGDWITLVACICDLLQPYSEACSKQILLIRDKDHNSLVVPFHFANYITSSNL